MNSMRCGGRRREVEVVGGAMPLAAGCGAIPLEEDGGVMLPRGDDGVTPSRGGAMPLGADGDGAMPVGEDPGAWRRWPGRCDVVARRPRCEAATWRCRTRRCDAVRSVHDGGVMPQRREAKNKD